MERLYVIPAITPLCMRCSFYTSKYVNMFLSRRPLVGQKALYGRLQWDGFELH
jgi:hypothetical protein